MNDLMHREYVFLMVDEITWPSIVGVRSYEDYKNVIEAAGRVQDYKLLETPRFMSVTFGNCIIRINNLPHLAGQHYKG